MSANVKLDFTSEEPKIFLGENVNIYNESDTESMVLTMDQFELLNDKYCTLVGEPTRDELEDKIDSLENKVSELQEQIEIKEEHEQARKEKYYDNEIF